MRAVERNEGRGGFTLVELAIVVVIIGVLAAFAVPRFFASVERSRAAEAFNYLSTVRSSMERFHDRQGTFASDVIDLDTEMFAPEHFTVGTVTLPEPTSDLRSGWELTLTRAGAPAGYGAYTVVYNQDGFDSVKSTIDASISPLQVDE